jgi:hypothetical protein
MLVKRIGIGTEHNGSKEMLLIKCGLFGVMKMANVVALNPLKIAVHSYLMSAEQEDGEDEQTLSLLLQISTNVVCFAMGVCQTTPRFRIIP